MKDNEKEKKEMSEEKESSSDQSIALELTRGHVFALQMAIADQLMIYDDAIFDQDLDEDTNSKAIHLRTLYRELLSITDIDDEGLLARWDEEAFKFRSNVISMDDYRNARKDNNNGNVDRE